MTSAVRLIKYYEEFNEKFILFYKKIYFNNKSNSFCKLRILINTNVFRLIFDYKL